MRSALCACAIALLSALGAPNLGSARETEPRAPDEREQREEGKPPEDREEWREQLLAANREVALARERSAAALQAYQTMRHRRRPRGEGKQAIMDELALSGEALTTARQNLEELERAARRAGAPPSWLHFDPDEIEAATQLPASPEP